MYRRMWNSLYEILVDFIQMFNFLIFFGIPVISALVFTLTFFRLRYADVNNFISLYVIVCAFACACNHLDLYKCIGIGHPVSAVKWSYERASFVKLS